MKRKRFLICYDIAHPKRLRQVAKTCESFGTRIQYSVFECPLDDLRYSEIQAQLHELINHDEDQVLFVTLGFDDSKNPFRIQSLGQPYVQRSRVTII